MIKKTLYTCQICNTDYADKKGNILFGIFTLRVTTPICTKCLEILAEPYFSPVRKLRRRNDNR